MSARRTAWRLAILFCAISSCERAREAPRVRRVITSAPSLTEIVFAIGRGDRVVGVSQFCDYPPEARLKPRVGGLVDPNLERMLSLRPDLVVIVSDFPLVAEQLEQAGVRTLRLRAESLEDVDVAIERLGEVLDARAAAGRLRRRLKRELDEVRERVRGRSRPRVLYVIERRPGTLQDVLAAGGRSFLTEVVKIAGGRNVLADVDRGAVPVSTERLVALAPDVILDATRDPAGAAPWRQLGSLPAVRAGRIVRPTDPALTIPGPRIPIAARRVASWLHPQAAAPR